MRLVSAVRGAGFVEGTILAINKGTVMRWWAPEKLQQPLQDLRAALLAACGEPSKHYGFVAPDGDVCGACVCVPLSTHILMGNGESWEVTRQSSELVDAFFESIDKMPR